MFVVLFGLLGVRFRRRVRILSLLFGLVKGFGFGQDLLVGFLRLLVLVVGDDLVTAALPLTWTEDSLYIFMRDDLFLDEQVVVWCCASCSLRIFLARSICSAIILRTSSSMI